MYGILKKFDDEHLKHYYALFLKFMGLRRLHQRNQVRKLAEGFSQDLTLASRDRSRQTWVSLKRRGEHAIRALVDLDSAQALLEDRGYPLLSCLMPTCDRFSLAQRAVECFRRQTYPNKELVIVNDGTGDDLGRWVDSLQDSRVRYIGLKGEERKLLGELRNITAEHARGEYIALWDDDDLSHPDRLKLQMQLMTAVGADGAFLTWETLWWPARRWLVGMRRRGKYFWENTMVFRKDKAEKWSNIRRHVDGEFCKRILPKADVVLCDMPGLYLRLFHGKNLWDESHFENLLRNCARSRHTGRKYDRELAKYSKAFGFELDKCVGGGGVPQTGSRSGDKKGKVPNPAVHRTHF